jgi:hypothetical protein
MTTETHTHHKPRSCCSEPVEQVVAGGFVVGVGHSKSRENPSHMAASQQEGPLETMAKRRAANEWIGQWGQSVMDGKKCQSRHVIAPYAHLSSYSIP